MENQGNSSENQPRKQVNGAGFGREKEDTLLDVYNREDVGDYVVINGKQNGAGFLVKIMNDTALLLPFQGMDYSKPYVQYKLKDNGRHEKVPMEDSRVTPVTKQELMEYINHQNEMLKKKWEKEQKSQKSQKARKKRNT